MSRHFPYKAYLNWGARYLLVPPFRQCFFGWTSSVVSLRSWHLLCKRQEIYRFLVRPAYSTAVMCQSDLTVFLANAQIARISTDRALAD